MATLQLGDFMLDATIDKAQRIFTDLKSSWNRLEAIQRQQFLRILIPDGIRYENVTVGPAKTLAAIMRILVFEESKTRVAAPRNELWDISSVHESATMRSR